MRLKRILFALSSLLLAAGWSHLSRADDFLSSLWQKLTAAPASTAASSTLQTQLSATQTTPAQTSLPSSGAIVAPLYFPVQIRPIIISSGANHTCAIMSYQLPATTTAWCWGSNEFHKLGAGISVVDFSRVPLQVTDWQSQPLRGAMMPALGQSHSCAANFDGTVQCWGDNSSGQLGQGDLQQYFGFLTVKNLMGATPTIAAGTDHTCVVLKDGTVSCWGRNASGQLGDGTNNLGIHPVAVKNLNQVTVLAAGDNHTCALTSAEDVFCWGDNSLGQLGDGKKEKSLNVPPKIPVLAGVAFMAAKNNYTCALMDDQDSTVKCWGDFVTDNPRTSILPKPVPGLTGVVDLTVGSRHICAVKNDGTQTCWGENETGQLGDGTTNKETGPQTNVQGLNGIGIMAAGDAHTCSLTDFTVSCWGNNKFGQLGDGSTCQRLTPVKVLWVDPNNAPQDEALGVCGCGGGLADQDQDGVVDCIDLCPNTPQATPVDPHGCPSVLKNCYRVVDPYGGISRGDMINNVDTDQDGTYDCNDGCPNDSQKIAPGICGCGVADKDTDGDGTLDCVDRCPNDPKKQFPGICGCGKPDAGDADGDGVLDCTDACPGTAPNTKVDSYGCPAVDNNCYTIGDPYGRVGDPYGGIGDPYGKLGIKINNVDSDKDGIYDCHDGCPSNPKKQVPDNICGCGNPVFDPYGKPILDPYGKPACCNPVIDPYGNPSC